MRVGQPVSLLDLGIDDEDDVITPEDIEDLTPDKVFVNVTAMHYGMKDKNPLDFVKFYPKNRPNGMPYCILNFWTAFNSYLECFHARRGDLSLLRPANFAEILLRVYTKDVRFVFSLPSARMYY